jgi:Holin of 3TMs, for gene-transfer release
MGWLSMIAGLFGPAKELVEVFKPNAEHEAERGHSERLALSAQDLASLQQFAAEFQPRAKSTWWDSFIDGLNRLPRPLITLSVGAFFVLAPLDPLRFAQVARAYELMPDGFWALLSIIVAFYFGGRMRLKRQDMAVKGGALAVAQEVLSIQRAAREHDPAPPAAPTHADARPARADAPPALAPLPQAEIPVAAAGHSNRVIEAWKHQRGLAAQG